MEELEKQLRESEIKIFQLQCKLFEKEMELTSLLINRKIDELIKKLNNK